MQAGEAFTALQAVSQRGLDFPARVQVQASESQVRAVVTPCHLSQVAGSAFQVLELCHRKPPEPLRQTIVRQQIVISWRSPFMGRFHAKAVEI